VGNSGLTISPTDTWVFGEALAPSLGTLHYDGHTWTKVKTGTGLLGASALSATSIWAFGPSGVGRWNGHTWKRTSVARLLPKSSKICGPGFLNAIDAISATNVFADGTAGCRRDHRRWHDRRAGLRADQNLHLGQGVDGSDLAIRLVIAARDLGG
jgi:hypothetical protein